MFFSLGKSCCDNRNMIEQDIQGYYLMRIEAGCTPKGALFDLAMELGEPFLWQK